MTQWRKIKEFNFYRVRCRVGYGSVMCTLDCGHTKGYKQSEFSGKGVGSRVKCGQCLDVIPKSSCRDHGGTGEDVVNCHECNEEFEYELNGEEFK